MMTGSDRFFCRIDQTLDLCERALIAILTIAALALGTMQVTLRYVFETGFHWNEAVFVLCTVTAMLAAGVRAVREDAHVRVDLVNMLVAKRTARLFDILAYFVSFALCVFYAYCGYLFVKFAKMMDTASPETGLKDWVVYSIMPTMMAAFALRYILKIRDAVLEKSTSDAAAPIDAGDLE